MKILRLSRCCRPAQNLNPHVLGLFPKLKQRRRQLVRTMSGGERQMVAIGRAMMSAPTILLLDEPSLGLSPLLTPEMFRALARIKETGMGILLVEQNAKQTLAIADRGYLLDNGHIVGADTAEALRKDEKVKAAYLGEQLSHRRATEATENRPSHNMDRTPSTFRNPNGSTRINTMTA